MSPKYVSFHRIVAKYSKTNVAGILHIILTGFDKNFFSFLVPSVSPLRTKPVASRNAPSTILNVQTCRTEPGKQRLHRAEEVNIYKRKKENHTYT